MNKAIDIIRSLGIAIAILCRLFHYLFGNNEDYISIAIYFMFENLAWLLICLSGFNAKKVLIRLICVNGFAYFSSAFAFYVFAISTNQHIYFSNCGEAGVVLGWLIAISTVVTLLHAYARK